MHVNAGGRGLWEPSWRTATVGGFGETAQAPNQVRKETKRACVSTMSECRQVFFQHFIIKILKHLEKLKLYVKTNISTTQILWLALIMFITSVYLIFWMCFKTSYIGDFPGGAVVRNPPANAGDTGLIPGLGRSHMPRSSQICEPQLLSLLSRAREPQLLSPRAQSPCSATREATAMRSLGTTTKSSPRSLQLEKAHAQQQRPHTAK